MHTDRQRPGQAAFACGHSFLALMPTMLIAAMFQSQRLNYNGCPVRCINILRCMTEHCRFLADHALVCSETRTAHRLLCEAVG
jgi:hypothetical protein